MLRSQASPRCVLAPPSRFDILSTHLSTACGEPCAHPGGSSRLASRREEVSRQPKSGGSIWTAPIGQQERQNRCLRGRRCHHGRRRPLVLQGVGGAAPSRTEARSGRFCGYAIFRERCRLFATGGGGIDRGHHSGCYRRRAVYPPRPYREPLPAGDDLHEAHLPAECAATQEEARIPVPHADQGRARHHPAAQAQGPERSHRVAVRGPT